MMSRRSYRLAFAILLATAGRPATAQDMHFDHLSMAQGLSQSTVTSIAQDRRGFMWFGTYDGLNRYDGYRFTVYKFDRDDPGSLSHNWVISLAEGPDGSIWVGTQGGGLNRFDPTAETSVRYRHDPDDGGSLGSDLVSALHADSAGSLWIGAGGLNR